MKQIKHLIYSQKVIWRALNYFLYDSINLLSYHRPSIKKKPFNKESINRIHIQLKKISLDHYERESSSEISTMSLYSYAELLAKSFSILEAQIEQEGTESKYLPSGQHYHEWKQDGGFASKYWPVHDLRNLLACKGNQFFLRAIVHGSVATLDDTPGFSDLDLAFIVRSEVLKDADKLLELRRIATEILILTYAFDPFMHHGPYYIPETDLKWYPEALFPSILFGYGVELLDTPQELEIWPRSSDDITDHQLNTFERFFKNWPANPFMLKDSYELEWVLGSTMILPALYLQRKTREFRYKRDTFSLAEKDFSPEEWEPIRTASALRTSLGPRPKPPRPLVWLARQLRWPGLLQRWARRHPDSIRRAQKATETLGPDYPLRVLRLLQSMRSKLPGSAVISI